MVKIKKLHVLSKKPLRANSSYPPLFSLRTKLLIFTGLFLTIFSSAYLLNQTIQLTFFVPTVPERQTLSANTKPVEYPIPVAVTIDSLHLAFPVYQTEISNGTWTIAPMGVSHLSESANPGENGPGIYYAHNTKDKFGPLRWIKKNAHITITTRDLKEHTYTVVDTKTTSPTELSVFFTRKDNAIYLFTCDGFADVKRFIVIAEPLLASPSASPIQTQ